MFGYNGVRSSDSNEYDFYAPLFVFSVVCPSKSREAILREWTCAFVRLLYHSELFKGSYPCAVHTVLLSLLTVISILSAIFPSRAAPAHAVTRLGIITSLFYGWMNFKCGDCHFLKEKKKKKSVHLPYALSG